MQIKLLNDIIGEIIGKQASDIINILFGKKDINEFLVAKKLKLTINQVRNIFYKLSNFGLVSFIRRKDKRKGWYTYFWTLNIGKALELLDSKIEKKIDALGQQLKSRETKRFYFCRTCKTDMSEETALLHNFTCQECGEVFILRDDQKILNDLRNEIAKLEKQRQNVLGELSVVKAEEAKRIEKTARKDDRKKRREKKKARNARKKLMGAKKKIKRSRKKSKKKKKKKL